LGDLTKLHKYYCNYGHACVSYFGDMNILGRFSKRNEIVLFLESICEGILFVTLGFLLLIDFKITALFIFILGFSIHFILDILEIHSYICKHRCIPNA